MDLSVWKECMHPVVWLMRDEKDINKNINIHKKTVMVYQSQNHGCQARTWTDIKSDVSINTSPVQTAESESEKA